jgi:hypothetical protein
LEHPERRAQMSARAVDAARKRLDARRLGPPVVRLYRSLLERTRDQAR